MINRYIKLATIRWRKKKKGERKEQSEKKGDKFENIHGMEFTLIPCVLSETI